MANYGIIRMQKFTISDVQGIQKHNQRQGKNSSNKDIDETKSHLNFDFLNEQNIKYEQVIKDKIKERVERKPRANSVVLSEFLITGSPDYLKNLSEKEQKKYFSCGLDFVREKYGEKNLVYASVHFDEETPHMHVGITPITEDNRLSAKDIFNGKLAMIKLQDDFHSHMTERGFDLERGESQKDTERKHVNIHKLKKSTEKELAVLQTNVKGLKSAIVYAKDVDDIKIINPPKFGSKYAKIAPEDIKQLKAKAKATEAFQQESLNNLELAYESDSKAWDWKQKYENSEDKNERLYRSFESEKQSLKRAFEKENGQLKSEMNELKTEIEQEKKKIEELSTMIQMQNKIIKYLHNTLEKIKSNSFEHLNIAVKKMRSFVGDIRVRMLENEFGKEVFEQNKYQSFIPQDEKASASKYRLEVLVKQEKEIQRQHEKLQKQKEKEAEFRRDRQEFMDKLEKDFNEAKAKRFELKEQQENLQEHQVEQEQQKTIEKPVSKRVDFEIER